MDYLEIPADLQQARTDRRRISLHTLPIETPTVGSLDTDRDESSKKGRPRRTRAPEPSWGEAGSVGTIPWRLRQVGMVAGYGGGKLAAV